MTLQINMGDTPWEPTGATYVETWHMYDIPTLGIFEQGGKMWMFNNVSGDSEPSFWSYHEIPERYRDYVQDCMFDSMQHMLSEVARITEGQQEYLARADDLRVTVFGPFNGKEGSL